MDSASCLENPSNSVSPPIVSADSIRTSPASAKPDHSLSRDQDLSAVVIKRLGDHPAGCGGHSDVWKAELTRNGSVTVVALKVMRCLGYDQAFLRKRLEREVKCWKPLNHKNIAPFYGIHHQSNGVPAIVLPWYENGSADTYLQNHPNAEPIQIIKAIAEGVEHLHEKGIVHGDLKGSNVMVDDGGRAILIDFGLARLIDSPSTTSVSYSLRWCAPELLSPPYTTTTKASDVYAFASTALELLTGQVPYDKIQDTWVPLEVMRGTTPPSLSSPFRYSIQRSTELWQLLESCWAAPPLRPEIQDVRQYLEHLYP